MASSLDSRKFLIHTWVSLSTSHCSYLLCKPQTRSQKQCSAVYSLGRNANKAKFKIKLQKWLQNSEGEVNDLSVDAADSTEARRSCIPTGRCPRGVLSKTSMELSHTVTQYSLGKAFWVGIASPTTAPLCCGVPEETRLQEQAPYSWTGPLSSSRGPGWQGDVCSLSMEPLMYRLPEISNSTQEVVSFVCLTLVVRCFLEKLR